MVWPTVPWLHHRSVNAPIGADATHGLDDPAYRIDRTRDIELSPNAGIEAALEMHEVHALIAPMGAAAKCTGTAGAPVVTIPAGHDSDGVPFSVSVFAAAGSDARLLDIAAAVELVIGSRQLPNCRQCASRPKRVRSQRP
jgi:amidase